MAKCFVAGTVQWGNNKRWSILASNRLVFQLDGAVQKHLSEMMKEFRAGMCVWIIYDCCDKSQVFEVKTLIPYEHATQQDIEQLLIAG